MGHPKESKFAENKVAYLIRYNPFNPHIKKIIKVILFNTPDGWKCRGIDCEYESSIHEHYNIFFSMKSVRKKIKSDIEHIYDVHKKMAETINYAMGSIEFAHSCSDIEDVMLELYQESHRIESEYVDRLNKLIV